MPTPRGAERLLALGVLLLLVLFALRAGFLLVCPTTTDYGEGTTWAYAHLLLERGTYFLPIHAAPYIHGTYPPLFPRLHAFLGGSLAAGRLLALLSTLMAAAAIAGILRGRGIERRRALLWAGMFLAAPWVHTWAAMCRVDTMAVGLSLVGLLMAERRSGELSAAPILAAAFYAKQIALAAPASVFLSLWLRGKKKRATVFAIIYAALVLSVFVILNWRSGGEVRAHLIKYTGSLGFSVGELLTWVLRFAFTFPVLLPLALWSLGDRENRLRPAGVYLVVSLATLIAVGKPGATGNYLLEPAAGVIIAGALMAERHLASLTLLERRRDFTMLLLVQLVALGDPGRPLEVRDLWREYRTRSEVVSILAEAPPGPVLAEDLGLTLSAGREPTLEPFQFWQLAELGLFDPAPVLADLGSGGYPCVVAGWRLRRIPGVVEVLEERYQAGERLGPYEIWRPRE